MRSTAHFKVVKHVASTDPLLDDRASRGEFGAGGYFDGNGRNNVLQLRGRVRIKPSVGRLEFYNFCKGTNVTRQQMGYTDFYTATRLLWKVPRNPSGNDI